MQKTNYEHEISQQPKVIEKLLNSGFSNFDLGLLKAEAERINKIVMVASGSSRNVAEISKNFFQELLDLEVSVQYASEYAHEKNFLNEHSLVIFISQSGMTADTLTSLKKIKKTKARTLALTNNINSDIHKKADKGIEVNAGEELAITATKSVTAELLNLYFIALKILELKGQGKKAEEIFLNLKHLKNSLRDFILDTAQMKLIADKLKEYKAINILGRSFELGCAKEGALKLKETNYLHACAYPTGEFLHGYLASVNQENALIFILPCDKKSDIYKLSLGNIKKILRDRTPGLIIILKSANDNPDIAYSDNIFYIDLACRDDFISPFFTVIAFQLLACELAKILGNNPDKPQSLTKAVLSE